MIEQLRFVGEVRYIYSDELLTHIDFNKVSWPVPRIGDAVHIRKGDAFLKGVAKSIEWYFTSGNDGPCVTIKIEDTAVL
jgi:hypothetical protein